MVVRVHVCVCCSLLLQSQMASWTNKLLYWVHVGSMWEPFVIQDGPRMSEDWPTTASRGSKPGHHGTKCANMHRDNPTLVRSVSGMTVSQDLEPTKIMKPTSLLLLSLLNALALRNGVLIQTTTILTMLGAYGVIFGTQKRP